jgi:hypothetical protein
MERAYIDVEPLKIRRLSILLFSLQVATESVGDVSLVLQIVILFLLSVGLLLVKGSSSKKNFTVHGYLTVLAVILHTLLIFAVMAPSLVAEFGELSELNVLDALNVWLHVVLGTVAEVLGVLLVVSWLRKPRSSMACARWKRWMLPTFVIWAIALVGGAAVHLLEIM